MSNEFKKLQIDQSELRKSIEEFCQIKGYKLLSYEIQTNKTRVKFQRNEEEKPALVDLLHKNDGTTTIQYKTGSNYEGGLELAEYLKEQIDPDLQNSVNLVLKNIDRDKFEYIKEFLKETTDEFENPHFDLLEESVDELREKFKIASAKYKDTLSITFYKTTDRLLLQGKPLFCYKHTVYLLSDDLDFEGLLSVVHKKDENERDVTINYDSVNKDLSELLPEAFGKLEDPIKKMLQSSLAVKNLDLELPDYSMVFFPVLRALEATIKKLFAVEGMYVGRDKNGLGKFIHYSKSLKSGELHGDGLAIACTNTKKSIESCYGFYFKYRHRFFHTDDTAETTAIIDTKVRLFALIKTALALINEAYKKS